MLNVELLDADIKIFSPDSLLSRKYIGFWPRLLAAVVDTFLILTIILPLLIMFYGKSYFVFDPFIKGPLDILLTWLFPALAVIMFWIIKGASPGKMIISGVIVDDSTGDPPSVKQLVVRYYAYFISALPFFAGFIWIVFDKKKQGWHDKLAGTVVISSQVK